MTLRKEKREAIREKINKRLIFVSPEENIVFDVYEAILNSMEMSTVDSHEDYRQYLLEILQPKVLFHDELAMGEGKLVYMILMDFLRATGFKVKLSARKPLPLHVAEVLYMSEDQSKLEEDDLNFEVELMDEARNLFKKLNIPNSPRNRHVVYKRQSRNPLTES